WQHQLGLEDDTTVYSPVVSGPWVAATYTVFGGNPVGGLAVADARTGALLWHRQVPGSVAGSGLPAFAGRVVLAASRDGTIHGFDVGSGEALWSLRSEEHTSELQSRENLVCRLLLEKKKKIEQKQR